MTANITCDNRKKRNPGIELLRIFSMLLIIFHHYSVHGGFEFDSVSANSLWIDIISLGGKLGVNLFVLISGYYSCTEKFKFKRMLSLICEVLFYSVILGIVSIVTGTEQFSLKFIARIFFPFLFGGYWFINTYLLLFVCIPLLNIAVNKISKRLHGSIIILLLSVWTILPRAFGHQIAVYNYEYTSFGWFVLMFLIGAYFRKNSFFLYNHMVLTYSFAIISFILFVFSKVLSSNTALMNSNTILCFSIGRLSESNLNAIMPTILAILIFIVFQTAKIPQYKWIYSAGASTFGIYLAHDNPMFSTYMWKNIFGTVKHAGSEYLIVHTIICVIVVFSVGYFIELCRMNFIEKPLFETKIIKKIINKVDSYFL